MGAESMSYVSDAAKNTLNAIRETSSKVCTYASQAMLDSIKNKIGGLFNTYQVELCANLYQLQTVNDHTSHLIMSHPKLSTLHERGQVHGYGLEHNPVRNELLYSRVTSGIGGLSGKDYVVTNYADNQDLGKHNSLSSLEKRTMVSTMNSAIMSIFDDGMDCTSKHGGSF